MPGGRNLRAASLRIIGQDLLLAGHTYASALRLASSFATGPTGQKGNFMNHAKPFLAMYGAATVHSYNDMIKAFLLSGGARFGSP